ncbi:MAG: uracil-DNA glycosylase [Bacteroidales bacterium]|nr:uracil-DNA glycosylase [Bacteroidales bacterium]
MALTLPEDWKAIMDGEEEKPYFQDIRNYLNTRYKEGATILPAPKNVFRSFNETRLENLKVVLIGQDPYPTPGNACGLCFAIEKGCKAPASLVNILKEMQTDLGLDHIPSPEVLLSWPKQGVLMLNTTMTVEAGAPLSHSKIGWQKFTDKVISAISEHKSGVVFLLWGNFAQSKAALIDETKHHILRAAHPSPLAGGRFFGSRPFSQANSFLSVPINWTALPE